MKENDRLHKRCIPHGITRAATEAQEQEYLLKRDFGAQRPLKKFLTDITEVQCADGKLYVSPIMDCFNGEIVALEMRDNMKKELCIDTVRQLRRLCPPLNGAVLHSDRGSQYTSAAFRAELARCGLVQSLSGVGRCFDNARMESFFATRNKAKQHYSCEILLSPEMLYMLEAAYFCFRIKTINAAEPIIKIKTNTRYAGE